MTKKPNNSIQNIFLIAIIPLLAISIYIKMISSRPTLSISKEELSFTINKQVLYYFSLGNKRLISSYLWSYTLLESDISHFNKKDSNSWMFNRFITIAKLDPNFFENYLYGGQYLSIIKDDIRGAEILYNKGLEIFPNNFWLNYNSGFNYFFELSNTKKAYDHFSKIQYHPLVKKSAPFLPSLVAKIKVEDGGLKEAYNLIKISYMNTNHGLLKKRYRRSLYAIKAELDLDCLNSKNINCDKFDYNNKKYIAKSGKFYAQTKWKPFRVNKRKKREAKPPSL